MDTINAYSEVTDIELEAEVMAASSHRLIQMLFEKCLDHIRFSKKYILDKDIQKKHYSITKASDIIGYLRSCLNFQDERTVELSNLLDSIYIFIERQLLNANLQNEVLPLEHAEKAVTILKSGWDGIV